MKKKKPSTSHSKERVDRSIEGERVGGMKEGSGRKRVCARERERGEVKGEGKENRTRLRHSQYCGIHLLHQREPSAFAAALPTVGRRNQRCPASLRNHLGRCRRAGAALRTRKTQTGHNHTARAPFHQSRCPRSPTWLEASRSRRMSNCTGT